jgi:hypothetical protein
MNLEDAVRALKNALHELPREAIQWSLDHWQEAGPCFVELLERCANGADQSRTTKNALFFIIHVLAEKHEARSFPALCRILEDEELSESILSDAITSNLTGILIATYDGNLASLKRVIEASTANDYARASAIEALVYFARHGALTDDEMRAYMLHLWGAMRPRAESFIWSAWALAAANLGYGDLRSLVQRLIRRGFISSYTMTLEDFDDQLSRTLSDPERMAGLEHDRIAPFTSTISKLSGWYCFSEEYRRKRAELLRDRVSSLMDSEIAQSEPSFTLEPSVNASELLSAGTPESLIDDNDLVSSAGEPIRQPLRHVGRNDPCPCGSGRKFKKCCLD